MAARHRALPSPRSPGSRSVADDRLARGVAVGGVAASTLLLAVVGWAVAAPTDVVSLGSALDVGDLQVPLVVLADPTRWPSPASSPSSRSRVQLYSTWYLETDDRYPRFAATVSLFTAAMLLVVVSGDLVLTVVGWEVMGWCSYLLIGHWSRRHSARRAAHKAFLVTRVADIGFVLGVIGLAAGAGSTGLADVVGAWARPTECIDTRTRPAHRRPGAHGLRRARRHAARRAHHARRHRGARQVGPGPVPGLARRRHGGPHPGQRPHPRRDHGRGRHRGARRPLPAARR